MAPRARWMLIATATAFVSGCSATAGSSPMVSPSPTSVSAQTPRDVALGEFPAFPEGALPEASSNDLQDGLDGAVEDGTFDGATAAVVVAGSGSWSGAAGVDSDGDVLSPDAQLLTASVAKTITAAEVLHLVEEGSLGLDDPAAEHLPGSLSSFDLGGATIRDLVGMRSGIVDPPGYVAAVDAGADLAELLREAPVGMFEPGWTVDYENINFVLLGAIVEEVTGGSLWEALRAGVLNDRGRGFVYPQKGALAGDGWKVRVDAASLARWGYELYGGSVLSADSLRQMTEFRDGWYGLGVIDFGGGTPFISAFEVPAVGHGGMEGTEAAMVVAFPESGVVVAVQARHTSVQAVAGVVQALEVAATS